ncbi:hypothetical protein AMATHDRAFT_62308 [Amanita thiersii Skay4041]|uniref:Uncharacterized protein n=1 Tax=Amanita thiersii Skay4041 TaxID=703135 RepID=A0A2A9NQ69_9AGAR|nr:hypothetical protein AMATHDRAFT_62308 [Amanita thiersii Skay4041]
MPSDLSPPPQSHTSSPPQQPTELRHVTSSNAFRSPRRGSQMLRTSDVRLGSRSPGSIPSSPTSVHSSSSAIFERDIEPVVPPSPPTSTTNPHRIPRAKTTEHLELSVPSVLDSAAAILTGIQDPDAGDQIAVVTPASSMFHDRFSSSGGSGFTSPIGSFRSRSPSPLGLRLGQGLPGAHHRTDLLLNIPLPHQQSQQPQSMNAIATPPMSCSPQSAKVPLVPLRPTIQTGTETTGGAGEQDVRANATPSIVTPTSAYFSTASTTGEGEDDSSMTATSHDNHETESAAGTGAAAAGTSHHHDHTASASPVNAMTPHMYSPPPTTISSHPPSPTHVATKRLSFMSYSDLLASTPVSTLPLSFLTTSASSVDPPPHLPCVTGGFAAARGEQQSNQSTSAAASIRGFAMHAGGGGRFGGRRDSAVLMDDVGGEWEREGFGKGLEERLETLMPPTVGQKA